MPCLTQNPVYLACPPLPYSAEFPAGFDPKVSPGPHQGLGSPQTLELEELREGLAHFQCRVEEEEVVVVVVVAAVLGVHQHQALEGLVVQRFQWLERVVVKGPLGWALETLGVLVVAGHPP